MERLPFTSGWAETWRATWDLLWIEKLQVLGLFIGSYSLLVLTENLIELNYSTIPEPIAGFMFGSAVTILHAVAARLMVSGLSDRPHRGWNATTLPATRQLAFLSGLIAATLSLIDSAFAFMFILGAAGPALVVQTAAVEGMSLIDSFRLVRRRMTGHASYALWIAGIAIPGVMWLWIVASRFMDRVESVAEEGTFSHAVVSALTSGVVSGFTLALVSSLWLVIYLNSRALTDGTTTPDLALESVPT